MNTFAGNLHMDWKNQGNIKGIIFDYGGTIDSNGKHWAEILWDAYVDNQVPVTKDDFREAYVYGERYLATHPVIQPSDTFQTVLLAKTNLQIQSLIEKKTLTKTRKSLQYSLAISNQCYNFVRFVLSDTAPVLQNLALQYPLVLVSNFYGNLEAVLKDFGLDSYFKAVIESAVVNVRKPDPAIFELGIKTLGFKPEEVVVVGDSYEKDIIPARALGCRTIWFKGQAWEEEKPGNSADAVIRDLKEIKNII
jgi:putative hydrolase of the HAD superfamily